jgi:hypothetical protein
MAEEYCMTRRSIPAIVRVTVCKGLKGRDMWYSRVRREGSLGRNRLR